MTDAFLFDTNIATAMWDIGSPFHHRAREFESSLGKDATIIISAVTLAEIEFGLKTAPKIDPVRQATVRGAMDVYRLVMPITKHTVEFYSEIKAKLFIRYSPKDARGRLKAKYVEDLVDRTTAKSLGVQENDIWIAAQAMAMNLVLVTEDKMDRITSLQLNPSLRTTRWRCSPGVTRDE